MVRVPQSDGRRIGSDVNPYMIALHRALAGGWQPPRDLSKVQYEAIKRKPESHPLELVGFVATGCSFGANWFSTYARGKSNAGEDRNYARESHDLCLRDAPHLIGVELHCCSYESCPVPDEPSIVYCDPPYVGTTGYAGAKRKIAVGESLAKNAWVASKFWRWADKRADAGHRVFVSEYEGPRPEAYGSVVPDHLKGEQAEALEMGRAADRGEADREVAAAHIAGFQGKMAAARRAMADRWKIVWSKETIVNFASEREAGEQRAVVEKLFARE